MVRDGFMRIGKALVTERINVGSDEEEGKGWESESASK